MTNLKNEIWKDLREYHGYQASNMGRIKSLKKEWMAGRNTKRTHGDIILKPKVDNGYYRVTLCKEGTRRKTTKISRLVMLAFHGKSGLIVNHKDCNKLNDKLDNLEYCTLSENVQHAIKNNRFNPKHGETHPDAVLKERQVRVIKYIAKYLNPPRGTFKRIADTLRVNKNTVYDIAKGKNWKHVKV